MTYKELYEILKLMTDEELSEDVSVFISDVGEVYQVYECGLSGYGSIDLSDIIEEDAFVLLA